MIDPREATDPRLGSAPAASIDHPRIPVIETHRLRLRAHRLTDYGDCAAMWADPVVTRYIAAKPSSTQQTWIRFLAYLGHWSVLRFGYWAIEERSTAAFVGEIGFADFKRTAQATGGVPEIGFALAPRFHGRGFATEAVRAVVAWGDENLAATRTVCLVDPSNAASLHIVTSCGYDVFERALCDERPTLFLSRSRPVKAP